MSASGAPILDDEATNAEAVEAVKAASHTSLVCADDVASPEASASSESGEDGQAITSTTEDKHHVTKYRSAPALIQSGDSPTNSTTSAATLLNSPRRASPLTLRTPFGLANVDDDQVITISPSSTKGLSGTHWRAHRKVNEELSRCHNLVEQLQADLATERENAQHDRGVARQALSEAQDDITDLEAEVSELEDQLEIEQQNSQNYLEDYNRCDRDATAVIENCHERMSKLEADLNLEQRKARHYYAEAEEFMLLAKSWQDAFHQLGHDPEALWKMLVEELRVRGVVFDYHGHLHRVGLRKAVLSAEDADERVAGLGDRSLFIHVAHEGDDGEHAMDAMMETGSTVVGEHSEGNASGETNTGQIQMSARQKAAEEEQAEAETNEEYVGEKVGCFDPNDVADANRINQQTKKSTSLHCCGPEPLIGVDTEKALSHELGQGVGQGSDMGELVLGDQEVCKVLQLEDEANIENVASNHDLADVSNGNELADVVSRQDETDGTDADGYVAEHRMQSVKDRKMRAVSWSSGPNTAAWETGSRLLSPQTSSLGSRHAVPLPTIGNGLLGPLLWNNCRK